jgi:hypothetical protein
LYHGPALTGVVVLLQMPHGAAGSPAHGVSGGGGGGDEGETETEGDGPGPHRKRDLLKRRVDDEVAEQSVKWHGCDKWLHQICALYNSRVPGSAV